MADLEPRRSSTPRRARESRAYGLVLTGGTAAVVAVVGLLLAVFGVIGLGLPFLAAAVAAVCALLFRRTVSS